MTEKIMTMLNSQDTEMNTLGCKIIEEEGKKDIRPIIPKGTELNNCLIVEGERCVTVVDNNRIYSFGYLQYSNVSSFVDNEIYRFNSSAFYYYRNFLHGAGNHINTMY